jgi:hypothetical protein
LAVLFVAAFGRISFLNAAREARHNANGERRTANGKRLTANG